MPARNLKHLLQLDLDLGAVRNMERAQAWIWDLQKPADLGSSEVLERLPLLRASLGLILDHPPHPASLELLTVGKDHSSRDSRGMHAEQPWI